MGMLDYGLSIARGCAMMRLGVDCCRSLLPLRSRGTAVVVIANESNGKLPITHLPQEKKEDLLLAY